MDPWNVIKMDGCMYVSGDFVSTGHWLATLELCMYLSHEIFCSLCSSFQLMNCVETSQWRSTDFDNAVHSVLCFICLS
jgi:hypothetical protein